MYDLVVRGGTVHDGRGSAPQRADVGIAGDLIEAVGGLGESCPVSASAAERSASSTRQDDGASISVQAP